MTRATVTLIALVAAMTLSAQKIDRSKPPETAALPSFKLPPVFETTLPNGLRVVLVEDRRFPLTTLRLVFEAGSKFDPADAPGLSEATATLLTEGTKARSQRQIAEQLAEMGGALKAGSGSDGFTIMGSALAENLPKLLDLLADVSLNASFPDDEVKLYRAKRTQELIAERSEAAFWADEEIEAVVYGSHPYSRTNPTPESIAKLNRDVLAQFRDRHLAPNNAILILLGAIPSRDETLGLVKARFGAWAKRELPARPAPKFPAAKRTITLMDRPGSVQADIRVGRLAVDRADPDYFPLFVANTILGGGASSRMFMNIREKQGFAYDAHSSLQPRKNAGLFTAVTQVRNEVLEPALAGRSGGTRNPVETACPGGGTGGRQELRERQLRHGAGNAGRGGNPARQYEAPGPARQLPGDVHGAGPRRRTCPDSGRGGQVSHAGRGQYRGGGRRLPDRQEPWRSWARSP